MENKELLIDSLKRALQIELAEKISFEEIKENLAAHINHLINNDFQQLVMLLYKVDVNESKLRSVLIENKNDDAGNIISQLIIERQLQKIKTRKEFSQKRDDNSNEEKW
jgi:hypothetical protein